MPKREYLLRIERITGKELKEEYAKKMLADEYNRQEAADSEIWALSEGEKCYCLIMLQKKDAEDQLSENSMKITRFRVNEGLFRRESFFKVFISFYSNIENYYVENGIVFFNIIIPKIRGFSTKAIKLFKKSGFSEYKIFNSKHPNGVILMLKQIKT